MRKIMLILCIGCFLMTGCAFFRHESDYSKLTSEQSNDYGVVYEKSGNAEKAKFFYAKAIEKNPGNYVAMTNWGNVCFRESEFRKASELYESALRLSPEYIPALNNLANTLIRTGEFDKAEEILKKALAYSHSKEETEAIRHSLGELTEAKGNFGKTEKQSEKTDRMKNKVVIEDVPFFRQMPNECGPAALASVYDFYGVRQTPEMISQRVYDEKRKGSLNLKMLTDAREQGLDAALYSGSFSDIKTSVDSGKPLILMLASGLNDHHYIVVTGYDGEDMSSIIAHDGNKAFAKYDREKIRTLWKTSGYCTISVSKKR